MIHHFLKLAIATATFATGVCFGPAAAGSTGVDEPWCILDYEGNPHCYYRTAQDCLQAIANGSRGFCNGNPSSGLSAHPAETQPTQRSRVQ